MLFWFVHAGETWSAYISLIPEVALQRPGPRQRLPRSDAVRLCICPHREFWPTQRQTWVINGCSPRQSPLYSSVFHQDNILFSLVSHTRIRTTVSEKSVNSWAHTSCLSCDFPSEFFNTFSSTFLRGARVCVPSKASCFSKSLPCLKARLNQSGSKLFQIRPIILHGRFHGRESGRSRTDQKNSECNDSKQDNSVQVLPVCLLTFEYLCLL